MKVHTLIQEQRLRISREEAWEFFSTPLNLDEITPADAGFEVTYVSAARREDQTGMSALRVYEGQIITYKVKVVPLVALSWVTEISSVKEGFTFIDRQLFGPYRLWHHRHTFEEIEGGVLMRDLVHYVMPLGFIGEIARWWFVKEKLRRVFAFRREVLAAKFGEF
jgi:ligand-binding SRPBCC domain-containing protein